MHRIRHSPAYLITVVERVSAAALSRCSGEQVQIPAVADSRYLRQLAHDLCKAGVGLEGLGDGDCAVGALICFHDGDHDAGQVEAGAVNPATEAGVRATRGAVSLGTPIRI